METRKEWKFVKGAVKSIPDRSMNNVLNQESRWHIGLKKDGLDWFWVDTSKQVNNSDSRWADAKDRPLSKSNARCAVLFTRGNGVIKNIPCSKKGRFICEVSKKN